MVYTNIPLEISAGVQPDTDFTQQSTPHFVASDKIRWVDGFPEKIGGWLTITPDSGQVNGCPRNIYSYNLNNNINYIIGTHSHLYNLFGSTLTNITPVENPVSQNNVLSTFYGTLGANPIETVDGSSVITVTDVGHILEESDQVVFSGSTNVNGITAAQINTTHTIANVTEDTYQLTVSGVATSSGSGGGAGVVRATRIVSVVLANTMMNDDNIEISGLGAPLGGIPEASINGVRRIKNVSGSGFDIIADAFATSSVSNAGGDIDIASQIPEGTCDPTTGVGYGLGLYGAGLYGTPKAAANPTLPSVWSFDRFGNLIVLTQGNQTGLYSWDGTLTNLPSLVQNAPTAIDYTFVSNNIAVTLGASGVGNRIQWSDQANLTTWAETAENRAGQDDIEGAGDFISHAQLRGFNLLFTRDQVYSFRYIDRPFVWETRQIDPSRGLIARNARVVVNGICYWMGRDNFYLYRGGNVEIIPSNTINQSTLKKFVYENINDAVESKIFAWYNEEFNEIWWHIPQSGENEPDLVVTFNIRTNVWASHNLNRTAGEYPNVLSTFPILANIDGTIYQHERGNNDVNDPLRWTLTTPFFNSGTEPFALGGIHFDSIKTGSISVDLNTKFYPRGDVATTTYDIAEEIDKIAYRRRGRYWQYVVSGEELDQEWRSGLWYQEVKKSGRK